VGGPRGAAHRVHPGELEHVVEVRIAREVVPPLRVHEVDPRVLDPRSEVVLVGPAEDAEDCPVHLDAGDRRRVEAQRGEDVHAATHSHHEHSRVSHEACGIGGRVDGLAEPAQGPGIPVVVEGIR
jgi:hypothetical protein